MSKGDNKDIDKRKFAVIIGETFTKLLNPLSNDIPELLFPVCGIPIIEYMIDSLFSGNITDIIICVKNNGQKLDKYIKKFHEEKIIEKLDERKKNIKIYINEQFNSIGDCLRKIYSENIISTDFILISGLVISNLDMEEVYNFHLERKKHDKKCIMTSLLKTYKNENNIKTDYDDDMIIYNPDTFQIYQYESTFEKMKIELNNNISFKPNKENQEITKYKIKSNLYDSNICVCSPYILNVFNENIDFHSIRDHLYKNLIYSEIYFDTFYILELTRDNYIGLIRNPESYLKVNFEILNRWAHPVVIEDIMISPKLNINFKPVSFGIYVDKLIKDDNYSKAKLINSIVISKNSSIGESSQLKFTIVGEDVKIGKNCQLSNCIILSKTEIGDNTIINNSIISKNCIIKDNIEISNSILGMGISQESNLESERIYYEIDDEEGKILNVLDKDLFYQNLDDRETLFLCTTPNLIDEINYMDKKDNNNSEFDSDTNEDEEEEESEDFEEDDEYENELLNIINTGIKKNTSINEIVKELGALKNGFWETTNAETIKTCLTPIFIHFLNGENFNHNHIKKLEELLLNWKNLFKRFVSTENDMIDLISVIEKLCIDINEIKEAFHIIIQIMNSDEIDFISDEAIFKWRDNKESFYPTHESKVIIPENIHQENLQKMEKYIEEQLE